jgi:hypothetical protein
MAEKRTRGNPIPLIMEEHPKNYNGYPFITLIQYRKEHLLSIIDNVDDKTIKAYVLDMCGPEKIDEEQIINIAAEWYNERKDRHPISFEFSKVGASAVTSKIYRSFNIEFVTRIIGPVPRFEMKDVQSVKRRRRKPVPPGVKIQNNVTSLK